MDGRERGEWNVFENGLGEQLGDELATAPEGWYSASACG